MNSAELGILALVCAGGGYMLYSKNKGNLKEDDTKRRQAVVDDLVQAGTPEDEAKAAVKLLPEIESKAEGNLWENMLESSLQAFLAVDGILLDDFYAFMRNDNANANAYRGLSVSDILTITTGPFAKLNPTIDIVPGTEDPTIFVGMVDTDSGFAVRVKDWMRLCMTLDYVLSRRVVLSQHMKRGLSAFLKKFFEHAFTCSKIAFLKFDWSTAPETLTTSNPNEICIFIAGERVPFALDYDLFAGFVSGVYHAETIPDEKIRSLVQGLTAAGVDFTKAHAFYEDKIQAGVITEELRALIASLAEGAGGADDEDQIVQLVQRKFKTLGVDESTFDVIATKLKEQLADM